MLTADPYRCSSCGKTNVSSPAVQCALCHVRMLEAQTRNESHEIAQTEEQTAKSRRNGTIVKWVSLTLILIFGVIFKLQMHEDRIAMHAAAHGYDTSSPGASASPSFGKHVMAEGVERYTKDMCACADTTCASDVREKFNRFKQTTDADIPLEDRDAIAKNIDRLDACGAKIWDAARKNQHASATTSSHAQ